MADLGSYDDQTPNSSEKSDTTSSKGSSLPSTSPSSADELKNASQPDQKRKKRRRRRRRKPSAEGVSPATDLDKKNFGGKSPSKSPRKEEQRFQPMESDEAEESVSPFPPSESEIQKLTPSETPSFDESLVSTEPVAPPELPVTSESQEVPSVVDSDLAQAPDADFIQSNQGEPAPFPTSDSESAAPSLQDLEITEPERMSDASFQPELVSPASETNQNQDEPGSDSAPNLDYQYQYQYSDKPSVYEIGQDQSLTTPENNAGEPTASDNNPQPEPINPEPLESDRLEFDQSYTSEPSALEQNNDSLTPEDLSSDSVLDEEKERLQREATAQQAQKITDELIHEKGPQKENGDGLLKVLQNISGALAGILKRFFGFFAFLFGLFGRLLRGIGSFFGGIFNIRRIGVAVFVLLVLGGAYMMYSNKLPQKAYFYIVELVTPKPPPKIEVHVDEGTLNQIGINTILLFARNYGSIYNQIPDHIMVLDFFGYLLEPKVEGETGITGVTYYGDLRDLAQNINEFVMYLQNLEKLQNLYQIDVYEMLNQSTRRDIALLQYLEDLQNAKTKSVQLFQQMGINVDDLRASYESLNPEKARYEADFFAALQGLQSQKSDVLLKGFIDITQKQSALKARINALAKVIGYYEVALNHLDKRIEVVDKNKEALIQGIRVIEVPGGGVNIIIRP